VRFLCGVFPELALDEPDFSREMWQIVKNPIDFAFFGPGPAAGTFRRHVAGHGRILYQPAVIRGPLAAECSPDTARVRGRRSDCG